MGRLIDYNFEKYSAKDMVQSVEEWGYKAHFKPGVYGKQEEGFWVEGVPMNIRLPDIADLEKFEKGGAMVPTIRWETYDDMYYVPDHMEKGNHERNKELLAEHEKLFMKLKRKFGKKSGENPKKVKDKEWILELQGKGGFKSKVKKLFR